MNTDDHSCPPPVSPCLTFRRRGFATAALTVLVPVARAHGELSSPGEIWRAWNWDPVVITGLFLLAALYASGLRWLRQATAAPAKLRGAAWCFAAGWLTLVVSLVSPIHPLGQVLFSAHMTQHEMLMVTAAPLLILGRPMLVCLWAFPAPVVRAVLDPLRMHGGAAIWTLITRPLVAALLHAAALWMWHIPGLFAAANSRDWVHALQHASFLGSALVFWQSVLFGPRRNAGFGLGVAYLFFTALHSGGLGALIVFASQVWYPVAPVTAAAWGLTTLEDQQLGGLIMWVPGGLAYVVAALALFARWLAASEPPSLSPVGTLAPKCAPSS